jgi:hypothetical protein
VFDVAVVPETLRIRLGEAHDAKPAVAEHHGIHVQGPLDLWRIPMFVAPGTVPDFGRRLSREAAERVARNWWLLLFDGVLLIVAGFLLFSIDWTIRSLATFFGVVFILEGVAEALTSGIAARVRRANVITGLLSVGGI